MGILSSLILTLAIIAGQLIKLPLSPNSGVTLLDAVVLLLSGFGLLRLKFKLKKPPLPLTAALFFIFAATLSLALTPLNLTLPQFLISFFYTVRFGTYILLGWEIYSGAYPQIRNNIWQILIVSGLTLAVLGLLQFIFLPDLRFMIQYGWDPHFYRTASTFLDPNFLGGFLALTLILLYQNPVKSKKLSILFFALIYIALLTTFSRSSYGLFLIGFLTLAFLKKSATLAFLTAILFAVLLYSFQFQNAAVNRVTPLDRDETASLRFSTWQQGLDIFLKNPVLGIGFNAYNIALRQYRLGDEQFLAGKGSTTNDSSLLHILATTGLLGVFAYFLFIFGMIKSRNPVLISGIFGLLGHSFFVNSLFYPFILIWVILSINHSYAKPSAE